MGPQILHVADVHLADGDDREYSLAVLSEIAALANEHHVAALVIAGDLFDSFEALETLRADVRALLAPVEGPVLLVPGNHEELRAGSGDLRRFDLGAVRVLAKMPFEMITLGDGGAAIEVLAIPFQKSGYGNYRDWEVPPRKAPVRIAVAHTVVTGSLWVENLLADEARGVAMDPDLFGQFKVDYAALGHLHNRPPVRQAESCTINYAGSARVWRVGEGGERRAWLVDLCAPDDPRSLTIESAGQYRRVDLPLNLDGTAPDCQQAGQWQQQDYVHLVLSGLVDDEHAVKQTADSLREKYAPRLRRLEIDRDAVEVLAGIAEQPLARRFLAAWAAREPDRYDTDGHDTWLTARQLGLRALMDQLRGRR